MRGEDFIVRDSSTKGLRKRRCGLGLLVLVLATAAAHGQNCLSASDMDAPVRKALEETAQRYFEMSVHGNTAGLRQNSIALVSANFAGVESAVKENETAMAGAHATVRPPFLLTADGAQPLARAEFLCGVFGPAGQTSQSAVFVLNNLPPGKYGITILDVTGGKESRTLTFVLQQVGSDWKLAGYYARSPEAAGHDSAWYAQRARDFKGKSEIHNAWLYYREAIALSSPVDFMSTLATDKLYDEAHAVQPGDTPANGSSVDLSAAGKTYRWTEIFPLAVGNDLDVVVRYSSPDISNTQKTFQDNVTVMKAVVTKYPELRSAFAGMVARAVDPSGQDYGSMLPMKDIK
jgi:hypothetical protein